MKEWFDTQEAAEYLFRESITAKRVSTQTMRRWIRKRILPAQRAGNRWVIPKRALDAFVPPTPGARKGKPRKERSESE